MSKYSKSNTEKKSDNPFDGMFFGSANLVTTKNGNTVIEISLNIDELFDNVLSIEDNLASMKAGAGFQTSDGKQFMKLKCVPLREPNEHKSHFIVADYFIKK